MYQKSFLKNNDEMKDNIFNIQFLLHDITHEKIHKYLFIFLLNDFCSNIIVDPFVNQTGTETFIYF